MSGSIVTRVAPRARKPQGAADKRLVTTAPALRGQECPLELSRTAWIDPGTGSIAKIEAGIADTWQDVGLKTLNSEIEFALLTFANSKQGHWLLPEARVEVETIRQPWRSLHEFTVYKKFSVSREKKVTQK